MYVDPTLTNSFGAAILRYGHSLVPDKIALANVDDGLVFLEEDLKDNFFDPDFYHTNGDEGTDNLLKWQSTKRCPLSDRSTIKNYLDHAYLKILSRETIHTMQFLSI